MTGNEVSTYWSFVKIRGIYLFKANMHINTNSPTQPGTKYYFKIIFIKKGYFVGLGTKLYNSRDYVVLRKYGITFI